MKVTCTEIASAYGLAPKKIRRSETIYLCPRHNDHHASLMVNRYKDCFFCGPCGSSGGAWRFAAFLSGFPVGNKQGIADWLRRHGL